MINNINLKKISELIKKSGLVLSGSQTGYASIDRPWDKEKTKIDVPDVNCYEYLLQRSKFNASPVLARCHEDELTVDRLKKEVEIYAKSFQALGIKKGDIVPFCIQNTIEGIISFFALSKIGAVTTFLNATANKNEIESYIRKYNSKNIVISSKYSDAIQEIVDDCYLNKAIVVSTKDSIVDSLKISNLTKEYIQSTTRDFKESDKVISLKNFKNLGKDRNLNAVKTSKEDATLISYSSGSTGEPKAIVLTNEQIIAELISLKKTIKMQFGPQGNSMQVVPFNYGYGFIVSTLLPMYSGKTVALTPILTMSNLSDYLKMYRPMIISGIPPLYKSFLKNPQINTMDLSFLKYAVSGGDNYDITSKKEFELFCKQHNSSAKILDGSGNCEGCGCITNAILPFTKVNPLSVGKPLKGINIKIVNPESLEEVKYGQVGKFCFSGKNVMKEYYGEKDKTDLVLKKDDKGENWFYTDTLAHMDKKGWLYMDGRERRFFISYDEMGSPYKVYCDYVQSIIDEFEGISDAIVVGAPSDDRDLVPEAYIVLQSNYKYDQEYKKKLNDFLKEKLQSCAIPVNFIVMNEVLYTKADKVNYPLYEKMSQDKYNEDKKVNEKKLHM